MSKSFINYWRLNQMIKEGLQVNFFPIEKRENDNGKKTRNKTALEKFRDSENSIISFLGIPLFTVWRRIDINMGVCSNWVIADKEKVKIVPTFWKAKKIFLTWGNESRAYSLEKLVF